MQQRNRFALRRGRRGLAATTARADDLSASLKKGTPDLKSAGPLAFGPEGILFVGDTQGAAVFAIDTGDRTRPPEARTGPRSRTSTRRSPPLLGTEAKQVLVNDLAVNPISGNAYLSVARGKGPTPRR